MLGVVVGTVVQVAPFEVVLSVNAEQVRVALPELDWMGGPITGSGFAAVGDRLPVRIIGFNSATEQWIGSFRRVFPEQDPWEVVRTLRVGDHVIGKVTRQLTGGDRDTIAMLVEITPYVGGAVIVHAAQLDSVPFNRHVGFRVKGVDEVRRVVDLDLL
jgi:ribosomal protein S1